MTDNGQGALLYKVGDINQLIGHLLTFIRDNEQADNYIKSGYALVQKYDWGAIVKNVVNVYNKMF